MITRKPRAKLTPRAMELANIGRRYWKARLEDFPEGYKGLDVVQRYVDSLLDNIRDGYGLLIFGPKGHGKTHVSCVVLKRALLHNARGLLLPVNRLQEVVIERPAFSIDHDEISLFHRARDVDLLVLDDLGEEHTKDFNTRVLENLLRYRSNRRRATILTTNLKPSDGELEDRYGTWLPQLLEELTYPFPFGGRNWRPRQRLAMEKRFGGGS